MQHTTKFLLTAGIGAAAMYFLDPAQGQRRRELARDRLEHGRETAAHTLDRATQVARAVGHDVSVGADRTVHGLRAVRRGVGDVAEKTARRARSLGHEARSLGHEVGSRTERLAHGLRAVGRDTRERAARAGSVVIPFDGRRSGKALTRSSLRPLRLMGIPLKWLLVAGIGASAMYFLDPSQGLYRRARVRARFLQNDRRKMDGAGARPASDAQDPEHAASRRTAEDTGVRQEQPLPG